MKLILNDYPESLGVSERQEIPADTMVEYHTDGGDRFRVSPNEDGTGLVVSILRYRGADQMRILPKYSNQVEII